MVEQFIIITTKLDRNFDRLTAVGIHITRELLHTTAASSVTADPI